MTEEEYQINRKDALNILGEKGLRRKQIEIALKCIPEKQCSKRFIKLKKNQIAKYLKTENLHLDMIRPPKRNGVIKKNITKEYVYNFMQQLHLRKTVLNFLETEENKLDSIYRLFIGWLGNEEQLKEFYKLLKRKKYIHEDTNEQTFLDNFTIGDSRIIKNKNPDKIKWIRKKSELAYIIKKISNEVDDMKLNLMNEDRKWERASDSFYFTKSKVQGINANNANQSKPHKTADIDKMLSELK